MDDPEAYVDENSTLAPVSLYAELKVKFENYMLNVIEKSDGFSPTSLRFSTVYGLSPRMRFDLTVNQFTHELLLGNELIVYDPDTWRPYFHTEDFAEVVFQILNLKNELIDKQVFNVGDDKNNFCSMTWYRQ